MNIYLVLENRYGPPTWTDKSKAFLERNDAMRYFHELMTSDEIRGSWIPTHMPDINKPIDEDQPFMIKEVWLESHSYS